MSTFSDQESNMWNDRVLISKDNQYRILKHLSSSGNGILLLAITSDHYLVCLKIFVDKKVLENESELLRNVQRKIEDSFLPYLDYFIVDVEEKKYYIMVMKYFEGWIVLSDYLTKCLFHQEQRNQIIVKLESILNKIHKLGIVHQDLKPTRILIHSKMLHIRMIDLGDCITRFSENISEEEFQDLKIKDLDMLKKF